MTFTLYELLRIVRNILTTRRVHIAVLQRLLAYYDDIAGRTLRPIKLCRSQLANFISII